MLRSNIGACSLGFRLPSALLLSLLLPGAVLAALAEGSRRSGAARQGATGLPAMRSSLVVFVSGAAVGAAAVWIAWRYPLKWRRGEAIKRIGNGLGSDGPDHPPQPRNMGSLKNLMGDEVLREQLTRNIQFFGEEDQLKLANAFVVVVGLGVSPCHRHPSTADPAAFLLTAHTAGGR